MRYAKISLVSAALGALGIAGTCAAQSALERNVPAEPVSEPTPIAPPDLVPASEDDTPIGPALTSIVLLGADDAVLSGGSVSAIDTSRVPVLDDWRVRSALQRLHLGKPLSRRLIGEVEATIAKAARKRGRPFLSLSTPEQELTQGRLQIRVTEFRLAYADVLGADGGISKRILQTVREKVDAPVNSDRLAEDLDWLGRDPFLSVSARFEPGNGRATTDLSLVADVRRPIRSYAGWNNNGSASTGIDRIYLGTILGVPGTGIYATYQLTGSSDFWENSGTVINEDARYLSHGLRAYAPIGPRQDIELTVSQSRTNQTIERYFDVRQRTTEAAPGRRRSPFARTRVLSSIRPSPRPPVR